MTKAFSLIEVLICIAIISIVAAITFPIFSAAKVASLKTASKSNLRQLWLAVELYRQDHEPNVAYGRPDAMGLPTDDYFHLEIQHAKKLLPPHIGPTPMFKQYLYYPPNPRFAQKEMVDSFEAWALHCRASMPLIADFNFNDKEINLFNPYKSVHGIGIDVAGRIMSQTQSGNVLSPSWWKCASTPGG
jgi:prepilin-type N-terminal cleavage/methylation domain-containing protein